MRLSFLLIVSIFIQACSTPTYAPVSERRVTAAPGYHKVRKGETVYSIAWMYGLDYKALARLNRIPKPYPIYPNQVLSLKQSLKKHSSKRPPKNKTIKKTVRNHSKATYKQPKKLYPKKKFAVNHTVKRWIWPVKGKVVKRFSSRDSGKKGISIAGKSGRRIVATATGKVVYSGAGLVRYGKLIIIKHNDTYLSAYAHNRRILVKEGSIVKQGQQIAEMGRSGTDQVILHFEIRKNGKPVNPLFFLSKR